MSLIDNYNFNFLLIKLIKKIEKITYKHLIYNKVYIIYNKQILNMPFDSSINTITTNKITCMKTTNPHLNIITNKSFSHHQSHKNHINNSNHHISTTTNKSNWSGDITVSGNCASHQGCSGSIGITIRF